MKKIRLRNFFNFLKLERPNGLVALFFILLFMGLFLGDGKQRAIEVFGSSIVLVLWGYHFLSRGAARQPPKSLLIPWLGVALAAFLSTVFSESIGFSVSWWARFLCGYLLYRLFYDVATSAATIKSFVLWLQWFVVTAVLLSAGSSAFPQFRSMFPSMNLITLHFGHNHLADLLVLIAPFVISFLSLGPHVGRFLGALVYFCVVLATQARGAWLLVGSYAVAGFFLKTPQGHKRNIGLLLCSVALLLLCLASVVLFFRETSNPTLMKFLKPQTLLSRTEFWSQSFRAILQRPVLGFGPGTFFLVSTRLQSAPGGFSWFAHSEPLQIGAELGLLGLAAWAWLYTAHTVAFIRSLKQRNPADSHLVRLLGWSVALTFIYASYEFVLDYFVTWAIFWSAIGLCVGSIHNKYEK